MYADDGACCKLILLHPNSNACHPLAYICALNNCYVFLTISPRSTEPSFYNYPLQTMRQNLISETVPPTKLDHSPCRRKPTNLPLIIISLDWGNPFNNRPLFALSFLATCYNISVSTIIALPYDQPKLRSTRLCTAGPVGAELHLLPFVILFITDALDVCPMFREVLNTFTACYRVSLSSEETR